MTVIQPPNPAKLDVQALLTRWCDALVRYEIRGMGQPYMDGNLLCPSCVRVHGRAVDAVFPLLVMTKRTGERRYIELAQRIWDMTALVFEREDGSNVNDVDSVWRGITVFAAIALADALAADDGVLDVQQRTQWTERLERMGAFLRAYDRWDDTNVNYQITNALALAKIGLLLGRDDDIAQARRLIVSAERFITPEGLLYGEGRPFDRLSAKGCRPIDIGYNVEESVPAYAEAALLVGTEAQQATAVRLLQAHAALLLDDGGWDNSFGTRAFKWTWWGSRTSDGAPLAYLHYAQREAGFAEVARLNLLSMQAATAEDGLLAGGARHGDWDEPACIHHSFTHAKVLAGILESGLESLVELEAEAVDAEGRALALQRYAANYRRYYPSIDSLVLGEERWTATISAYDWTYLPEGHPSGGDLTLLKPLGGDPALVASMNDYVLKEPHNMQQQRSQWMRPLTPRLILGEGGDEASSLYGTTRALAETNAAFEGRADTPIVVEGELPGGADYRYRYLAHDDGIEMHIDWSGDGRGRYILPLIARPGERLEQRDESLVIWRADGPLRLEPLAGRIELPHGEQMIHNLVPGFMAYELQLVADGGEAGGQLGWRLHMPTL